MFGGQINSKFIGKRVRIKDAKWLNDEDTRRFAGMEGTVAGASHDGDGKLYWVEFDNGWEGEFFRREFTVIEG